MNDVNTWGQGAWLEATKQKQVFSRCCWVYGLVLSYDWNTRSLGVLVWLPHLLIIMASTTNLDIAPEPQLLLLLLLMLLLLLVMLVLLVVEIEVVVWMIT